MTPEELLRQRTRELEAAIARYREPWGFNDTFWYWLPVFVYVLAVELPLSVWMAYLIWWKQ